MVQVAHKLILNINQRVFEIKHVADKTDSVTMTKWPLHKPQINKTRVLKDKYRVVLLPNGTSFEIITTEFVFLNVVQDASG